MVKKYENALQKEKLKVLIFGPGKGNPDEYAKACYNKRLQIKKLLIENKHNAVLPEEAYEEAKKQGKEFSNITAFEKYSIEHWCDIAVFIYVPNCPGVEHELSAFSGLPECVSKIYCFYANDCKSHSAWTLNDNIGFIRGGKGHLDTFCRDDINKCKVGKKVSEIAEDIRIVSIYYTYVKYKGVR